MALIKKTLSIDRLPHKILYRYFSACSLVKKVLAMLLINTHFSLLIINSCHKTVLVCNVIFCALKVCWAWTQPRVFPEAAAPGSFLGFQRFVGLLSNPVARWYAGKNSCCCRRAILCTSKHSSTLQGASSCSKLQAPADKSELIGSGAHFPSAMLFTGAARSSRQQRGPQTLTAVHSRAPIHWCLSVPALLKWLQIVSA